MRKVLSVVISTYNRCSLLESGLKKMLINTDNRVDYIIGDNASTDNTWEMLNTIKDPRIKLYRNEVNLGFGNSLLLSQFVDSDYFLFLNDRDMISPDEISNLIDLVEKQYKNDMIFMCKGGMFRKKGKCKSNVYRCCFLSEHPGHIIYRSSFFYKYIDLELIKNNLLAGKEKEHAGYVMSTLLIHITQGYYVFHDYIIQPANRDKIVQTRREIHGAPYIMAGNQTNVYKSILKYLNANSVNSKRKKEIMTSRYIVSLYKTEVEYNLALKSESFRERYNCHSVNSHDWLKNGKEYTKNIIGINGHNQIIIKYIWVIFILHSFANLLRVFKNAILNRSYN